MYIYIQNLHKVNWIGSCVHEKFPLMSVKAGQLTTYDDLTDFCMDPDI